MNVFSYYHDVNYVKYPRELIARWESSWKTFGFDPVVLQESDARKHPSFHEYEDMVTAIPTTNDPGWERHCWLRWMAYDLVAPGMFTDWDVINFGLTQEEIDEKRWHITSMDRTGTAILYGSKLGIRAFVSIIPFSLQMSYQVNGREHIEDMHLMTSRLLNGLRIVYPIGWVYGELGYEKAKVIHFSNSVVPVEFRENNRWKLVDAVSEWRCQSCRCESSSQVLMSEHDTHL